MSETSKYQKFVFERWNRKDFNKAPYNPRKITEKAQKKLKKIIKSEGLVAPIVVNRKTKNIIGGHQRIGILDLLEKTNDYFLDVAVIEAEEEEEVRLNLILNNKELQGEYDYKLLGSLIQEYQIEISEVEFEPEIIDNIILETVESCEDVEGVSGYIENLKSVSKAQTDSEKRKAKDQEKEANMTDEEKQELEQKKKAMYEKIDQQRKGFREKDEERNLQNNFKTLIIKFDEAEQMVDFLESNNLDIKTKSIYFDEFCNLTF